MKTQNPQTKSLELAQAGSEPLLTICRDGITTFYPGVFDKKTLAMILALQEELIRQQSSERQSS